MNKVYLNHHLIVRAQKGFFKSVTLLVLLIGSISGYSQTCYVTGTGAAASPTCSNQVLNLGAGEFKTMTFAAGVYYTFSFANNAQTDGFCVNGIQYLGNPTTIAPGAGTFNVSMYRANGTWAGGSATLTYRIETPAAPQAVGNITVGPAQGLTGALNDANFSASGCWNGGGVNGSCSSGGIGGHEAYRGRLFRSGALDGGVIGWAVDQNSTGDYWQVDFGSVIPVNGVASQGREDADQWLGTYTVATSLDGTTWYNVPGTFSGNADRNTVAINWFGQYHARYVRITTTATFTGHQSARFEVLSIPEGSSASTQTVYASAQFVSNAGEIRWYDAAAGGTLLGTGRTIGRNITANTTIYAASYNGGCESARTAVTLRINDIYGQGPAGVGNTNGKSLVNLWLNSDSYSAVANGTATGTWTDLSGKGNNATQGTGANQPLVQTSIAFNNQKVLRFDGTNDILGTSNYFNGFYAASTPNPFTTIGVASYRGDNERVITSNTHNWLLGWHGGLEDRAYYEGWLTGSCASGGVAPTNTPIMYTGTGNRVYSNLLKNGAQVASVGNTCGLYSPASIGIGGTALYGEYSNADVAEVITSDLVFNDARLKILHHYLHAKYGIAISGDIYLGDGVDFCDFEVSGVGRESSGVHTSGWSGGLYVTTTISDFLKDNGDYILFGRNASTGGWETSTLATCGTPNPSRRLSRIWYIDKTDGGTAGGNVTLSFDLNELQGSAPLAANNYRLMYRVTSAGTFASVATGTVVGNRVQFTLNATAIVDGEYTLGYDADIPRSMSFNGSNQYIETPSSTSLQTPSDFSYEMWVRPTSFSMYNTYFENGQWAGQTTLLRQESPTQINLYISGTGLGAIAYAPPLNTWTHLALVRSGSTITLYANGVSVGNFTSYGTSILPTNVMRIGSSVHSTGQMFNGQIDEFRLWNRALTPVEITNRMHSNITNLDIYWNNLQAYYKFDESGGTKVFDLSQNNNNGTPVNSPTVVALHSANLTDIAGTSPSCNGTTTNYTAVVGNANSRLTYNWLVSGATINSGQGTNTINVTWTSTGVQTIAVQVTHSNECHQESYNENISTSQPSIAPTSVTGTGTFCPGNTVPLTQVGGTLNGLSYYEWFTGGCGSVAIGAGPTMNVSPTTTTTYYVRASANGGCPATTCASGTVTMPSPSNTLSADLSTATCTVTENAYVHFYDNSGRLVMSINSNGQNLGTVNVTSYVNGGGAPVNIQACDTYQPWYVTAALGRRWVVSPQFQPASPVSVRLYFDNSEVTALSTVANSNANPNDNYVALGSLDLSKYSNTTNPALVDGSFANNCSSGSSTVHATTGSGNVTSLFGSFSATGRYTQYSFTGFSELWLSGTNNVSPLPIELTSFTAICDGGGVRLDWTTATEINNEKFIIDRSADLQSWEPVTTFPGAGNSNQPLSYQTIDDRPLDGISYYRLTQHDYDGKSETFEPISVTCYSDGNGNTMLVYPNPASDQFVVSISLVEDINNGTLEMLDMNGKIVLSKNIDIQKGNHSFSFDRTAMNPGVYIIRLKSAINIVPIKLVIK